ncbi:hypothetical protein AC579_7338 [Pseudocercospora musae]|uniref:TATA element modulatory factor 1 TATA binding domain-containing protein n=1 Tax=Pseudocercospora musae TaxID=113226 RepID=A0A139ICK9_9PEZI|nr:hypothetical protein AC579_7338 [Pseudocercospora musae]
MSQKKGGGWGSVFSGAIANLESRLDTVFADDSEVSATAPDKAAQEQKQTQAAKTDLVRKNSKRLAAPGSNASAAGSRDASRTRVSDRLAERLAKATAAKTTSRASTPVNVENAKPSGEWERDDEASKPVPGVEVEEPTVEEDTVKNATNDANVGEPQQETAKWEEPLSLTASTVPINPARISFESSLGRPSADSARDEASARTSLEAANGSASPPKNALELQADMEQMQEDYRKAEAQRQEEMHVYLERIDALQAKLTYLAKETVAAAKEANAATGSSLEKQLAEKDEKIALLMEEGEKLSKTEMQRLQTIKKLRAKAAEDEKMTGELRKRLNRVEASEVDLKAKLRKAQVAERQASEKIKQIATIEKQVDELKVDRENAAELVRSLTAQLKEARESTARAAKEAAGKATEAEKAQIANLQNELEDAQIEKKLAEDRATAESKKYKEESDRQREKFAVQELELKNEIHGLESRLEAMRARLEESSTTTGAGDGESAIKLMRQVETLQQQYALAKSNWETIEGSLNARVAALEKERDEASKRETETRKKARDAGARSRRAEEDLENANDQVKSLERELQAQQEQLKALTSRVEQAEIVNADSRADFERQRKLWESELASRVEEEKIKWRRELAGSNLERLQSPTTSVSRKASAAEFPGARSKPLLSRFTSHDLAGSHTDSSRPSSAGRRSNVMPTPSSITARALTSTPTETSPGLSRRESTLSFDPGNIPPTPSVEIDLRRLSEDGDNSPQRTIADLVSTSTAGPGAGPSVQLVDRLSGLVRKLESEKASFKDELRRLTQQRDEARSEVVDLMRESETKGRVETLKEMTEMKQRYEASLEILGEREEEIDDLKDQIAELKTIYKELVESKVGGGSR